MIAALFWSYCLMVQGSQDLKKVSLKALLQAVSRPLPSAADYRPCSDLSFVQVTAWTL